MLKELTLGKSDPRIGLLCQGLQEISVTVGPTEFWPPKKPWVSSSSIADLSERGVRWDLVPCNFLMERIFEFLEALPRAQAYKHLDIPKASGFQFVHFWNNPRGRIQKKVEKETAPSILK